jgi:hypothetical protein
VRIYFWLADDSGRQVRTLTAFPGAGTSRGGVSTSRRGSGASYPSWCGCSVAPCGIAFGTSGPFLQVRMGLLFCVMAERKISSIRCQYTCPVPHLDESCRTCAGLYYLMQATMSIGFGFPTEEVCLPSPLPLSLLPTRFPCVCVCARARHALTFIMDCKSVDSTRARNRTSAREWQTIQTALHSRRQGIGSATSMGFLDLMRVVEVSESTERQLPPASGHSVSDCPRLNLHNLDDRRLHRGGNFEGRDDFLGGLLCCYCGSQRRNSHW